MALLCNMNKISILMIKIVFFKNIVCCAHKHNQIKLKLILEKLFYAKENYCCRYRRHFCE
jgi:hypothetical protein